MKFDTSEIPENLPSIEAARRGRPPLPPRVTVDLNKLATWADDLERVANLRAGCMDSENRHAEIASIITNTLIVIAAEMRAAL